MHRPELLVLDEPTSGLDPLVQQTFHELVKEASDRGQTVFLSSHVLSEIQETADRVAVLRQGQILATSTVSAMQAAALRNVHAVLELASPSDIAQSLRAVPGLVDLNTVATDHNTIELTARLGGDVDPFIRTLTSAQHIVDLKIEEPDLEEAVLAIYRGEPQVNTSAEPPSIPQRQSPQHHGRHSR